MSGTCSPIADDGLVQNRDLHGLRRGSEMAILPSRSETPLPGRSPNSLPVWIYGVSETKIAKGTPDDSNSAARPAQVRDSIQGIGFVEPVSEVRKLVFKVNGVIAKCSADLGRSYQKGALLMELGNREQLVAISRSATERKDLDVVQVMVDMQEGFREPVGLEVDVKLEGEYRR